MAKTRDVLLQRLFEVIPISLALFDPLRGAALKALSEGPFQADEGFSKMLK